MKTKIGYALIVCFWTASAFPADMYTSDVTLLATSAKNDAPDSRQMENNLQHLSWKQFRSIIVSVPKMKADVDAFGPIGWQYVQANYKTYSWRKSIDRLDDIQKKHLAELILVATAGR